MSASYPTVNRYCSLFKKAGFNAMLALLGFFSLKSALCIMGNKNAKGNTQSGDEKPATSTKKTDKLKEVTGDTYKGATNDLQKELSRLKEEYKDNYQPLYERKWMKLHAFNDSDTDTDAAPPSFSMLQFNILADGLSGVFNTGRTEFDKSPSGSLPFKYRGFRIVEEIVNAAPDIVTLEEVDAFEFVSHYLSPFGYSGCHQAKPHSPCISIGRQNNIKLPPDGVAVFYKRDKFQIVDDHVYRLTDRNVAMLVHFRMLNGKNSNGDAIEFLVGVTHLKASKDSKGEGIRLKQLQTLLSSWKKIRSELGGIDLFIGCDFNSPPINTCGFPPMAYHSVVNGMQFIETYVNKEEEKTNESKIAVPKEYESGYALDLSSAYKEGLGDEPAFTTYKSRGDVMRHTIDYLFYMKQRWNVTQLLSIPGDEEIDKDTYIPAWNYPSDHFAIGAVFEWKTE
mmetsp:Transcript_47216/g.75646  ORF Transcript_47216/g.75646 Transcript_47216/m.75646 type:complete len:451 (-) Transcript_47216:722-2074(-)